MISTWTFALQATALTLALVWLVLAMLAAQRTALTWAWAVFCGSIALLMLKNLMGDEAGAWQYLLGIGACATCNAFWLVARGLFRSGVPFALPQLLFAGSIALLIAGRQLLHLLLAWQWLDPATADALGGGLGQLLNLLGSTVLVLAFREGCSGWSNDTALARHFRLLFLCTYGGCVLLATALPAMLTGGDPQQAVSDFFAAAAAVAILLATQLLVRWRGANPIELEAAVAMEAPVASPSGSSMLSAAAVDSSPTRCAAEEAVASADDLSLAARVENHVRGERAFLRSDLKLVHVAQALDVPEYRISRAVTRGLQEPNFNQYINRQRVAHACSLLTDPSAAGWTVLVVGLESGFGSLGPFNRAFKAITGQTPAEYRERAKARESGARGAVPIGHPGTVAGVERWCERPVP